MDRTATPQISDRPRVAFVAHGGIRIPPKRWGATERVIWNLHKDCQKHGFDSTVVNTKDPGEIVRRLGEYRPNLVHLHAEGLIAPCRAYCSTQPTPLLMTSHTAWPHANGEAMPAMLAEPATQCDTIVALSPSLRERFLQHGCTSVCYIPNGVDTSLFRPLAKKPHSVLAVGRNAPRKRLPEIARFFLEKPQFQLTICGPGADDPPEPRLQIPKARHITLLGNQTEAQIARLAGQSEYFVHLCEVEASALVVREAMACGCKVWTAPYNAQDLKNVSLTWEGAISDPELGRRAAQEAVDELDWSHIVRRHVELYRATLARRA